jgi:hypothetical protein
MENKITNETEQILTYNRQGVSGTTPALPNMGEAPMSQLFTLDDRVHTVVDFLSRPIDVAKLTWNTNTTSELIPGGIAFPDVFLQNPMYKEKLRGFLGLKGMIKIKVMINPQPFQAGLLLGYWIPNAKEIPVKVDMVQASLSGKSGCPNIQIMCEGGTEQILEIPYVNQHVYYNMATDDGNYGKFFLVPILPLDQGSLGIRIQAWIEFPQPQFATSAVPVLSQASSQTEEENLHDHTILTSNGALATVDSVVSALSDFSLKPSYLTKGAANVLQLMGYSKPINQTGICRTSLRANSYMPNFNGEFMGHKMALAADNILADIDHIAGTDSDEMSLSHISQIPTYYRSFTINALSNATPMGENYVTFVDSVHPQKFVAGGDPGTLDSTFVGYASSAFAYWRGGLKYTFKIAKTPFHSVTLRATYLPGVYDFNTGIPDTTATPAAQLERVYQTTFDFKKTNEFTVVVPYANTLEYLQVVNPFGTSADAIPKKHRACGVLLIDIFVPLVASAAASSSVQVAVFVSGAKDISYANPTAPSIYPYSTVTSQSFSLQEPTDRVAAPNADENTINGSQYKVSLLPSGLCTGEVITSIKSLLSRFGPFYSNTALAANSILQLSPFDFQDPASTSAATIAFDYLDYFSYLYAFYRGGVRFSYDPGTADPSIINTYRILLRSNVANLYPQTISRTSVLSTSNLSPQLLSSPFATALAKPSIEGVVDFEVPYYNRSKITPALTSNQTMENTLAVDYPSPVINIIPRLGPGTVPTTNQLIFRAAADDFRFFYLIGPPRVTLLDSDVSSIPFFDYPSSFDPDVVTYDGGNAFKGFFGNTSVTLPTTAPGLSYDPPAIFSAVDQATTGIYFLPRNVNYGFYHTGNQINVTSTAATLTNVRLQTEAPGLSFATTNTAPNMFTLPSNITFTPAAAPQTPLLFKQEVCTLSGATSITIPSQSSSSIAFGTAFTLTNALCVFRTSYVLLSKGTVVIFSLSFSDSLSFLRVTNVGNATYGFVPISVPSQPGFLTNTPTNTWTRGQVLLP